MDLSITTCSYNAENTIEKFVKEINHICKNKLKLKKYEIIITDDYSTDNTVKKIKKLIKEKYPIKLILLSKNCGNHYAIKQSIKNSKGKIIFEIDSDLEISVNNLEVFWKEYKSSNRVNLVYAVQKRRTDNIFNNFFSNLFYILLNLFSDTKIPHNQLQCRMFNNQIKKKIILNYQEGKQNGFFYHELNVKKKEILVKKTKKDFTNYSFKKRTQAFLRGLIFNSNLLINLTIFLLLLILSGVISVIIFITSSGNFENILNTGWIFNSLIILFSTTFFVIVFSVILMYIRLILLEINLLKTDFVLTKINFK